MQKNHLKIYSFFSSIDYFCHFIAKIFLFLLLGFFTLLLLVFAVYMGDLFINTMTGNSKKPLFGAYVVMSGSMVPTIQVKDGIVVRRVENDQYDVGDVITFLPVDNRYGNATITHRIIDKRQVDGDESIYITKGDHNSKVDSSVVKTRDIYGKVLFRIPKIGYVQDFLARPSNYFICLLGFSLLFIMYQAGKVFVLFMKERVF